MTAPAPTPASTPAGTAYADQLTAAAGQARAVLAALATHQDGADPARLTEVPGIVKSPWLTDCRNALVRSLATGTGRLCPHIGQAPRVVHAAVWAPGRLVCSACLPDLTPDPAEDATCDRCRRHTDRIHGAVAALGPVLLTYGLCPTCRTSETPLACSRRSTRRR